MLLTIAPFDDIRLGLETTLKIGSMLTATSSLAQEALKKRILRTKETNEGTLQKVADNQAGGVCACARGCDECRYKSRIECARLEYIEKGAHFVIIQGSARGLPESQ